MIYTMWARVLWIMLLYLLMSGVVRGERSWQDYRELREKHDVLARIVEDIKTENRALSLEMQRISHSQEYAHKVLRDKYHMLHVDEELIFFDE